MQLYLYIVEHTNGKKKRRKEKEEIKYCLFATPRSAGLFFSKPEIRYIEPFDKLMAMGLLEKIFGNAQARYIESFTPLVEDLSLIHI